MTTVPHQRDDGRGNVQSGLEGIGTRALEMGHSVRVLSLRSSVIHSFVTEP